MKRPLRSKKRYEERLKDLEKREEEIRLRDQVRKREEELGLRRTWKKPAWSKAMMAVIYAICLEIIIYSEAVMWVRYDLSALYALIGVPAAMFGVFWAYAEKSKAENTQGGITYDAAMQAQTDPVEPEDNRDENEGVG